MARPSRPRGAPAVGVDAETLHPPAAGAFPPVAWDGREDGIVCIGRLAPEKRLEYVIEVRMREIVAEFDS